MPNARTGFDTGNALSYATIERRAIALRTAIGVRTTEAIPGLQLFERLNRFAVSVDDGRAILLDYEVSPMDRSILAEAAYEAAQPRIVIRLSEATYRDLESDGVRARFTLAHEVGHAVLHANQLIRLSRIPRHEAALLRRNGSHPRYRDTEWQANAYAAALLMPAKGLVELEGDLGSLSIHAIQTFFQVSTDAARIRLETFQARRQQLLAA